MEDYGKEILPIVSFSTRSFVIVPHRSTDLVSQLFTDQRSLRAAVRKARKNWNSIVKEVILFTFSFINAVGVFFGLNSRGKHFSDFT